MLINFRKKGYSGIIPFVYEGKEEIHTSGCQVIGQVNK